MSLLEERGAPRPLIRRVFSLPTLVSLALAGAFLAFLSTRLEVDFGATWQHVRSANAWYLALAVAIHYTTFLFRGLRWRLLLNNSRDGDGEAAGVWQCSQLVLLGWFANSVAWLRLGDAYRAYLYHEERRAPFVRTMGTILSERLLDITTVALLLAVCLPFVARSGGGGAWTVVATAASLLGLLAMALLAIAATRDSGGGLLRRLTAWLPDRLAGWILERYSQFRDGALLSLQRIPLAGVYGLLGWLAETARLYLVTQALDIHLSPALIVFTTLANSLLTLVPTPGGVGAVEAGLAGLLKQLSTLSTPAVAALVVVDRSISYLSVIAVGAVLFLVRWAAGHLRKTEPSTADAENPAGKGGQA
ncbi:MAG: lysylphosphatidylglycerol synthase transmembrane domain-containing protein [Chloroflexota bacterium]|nr:lysylphosphatidylglycerol synthase transmembrane domain-containing protein [Chloroflexota bacterium]